MFPLAVVFQQEKPAVEEPVQCNHNDAANEVSNGPTDDKVSYGVDDIME